MEKKGRKSNKYFIAYKLQKDQEQENKTNQQEINEPEKKI